MNDEVENVLVDEGQPQDGEQALFGESISDNQTDEPKEELSEAIKKRLGQQKKKHNREMRSMQEQLAQAQQYIASQTSNNGQQQQNNVNQSSSGQSQVDPYRQLEMQKLEDDFNQDLEKASEKYEDFEDIIHDPRLPFTHSVRDILKVLDNPGDVIYSLGKNRDELYRIAHLSQHAQAKELLKLSKALTIKEKTAPKVQPKVLGQIKSNSGVNKNTSGMPSSISELRKQLRTGRK